MRIMNYGNDYAHRDKMETVGNVEERKTQVQESPEPETKGEGEAEKNKGRKTRKA